MLGLYIHIPFCVKKCKYCDFNSYKMDLDSKKRYIEDLKIEMELYSNKLNRDDKYKNKEDFNIDKNDIITSIFIGGGTPSILTSEEIREVFVSVKEKFNIDKNAEITIECNPGTLTLEKLETMKEVGINRLSIGLQAVQEKHLNFIGRIHSYKEFEKNYMDALSVGFKNINIDLMYSLPNQTLCDWKETLEKVTDLNPAHISAYSLILEEGTELYNMYENNQFDLIDENIDIEMYEYTINYLKSKGYNQYEISNYSQEGYNCKHNILYWECEHYIGLGAGASGYIDNNRYNNLESLEDYHLSLIKGEKPIQDSENLSIKDMIEEKIFMGLRMNKGIKFKDFEKNFGIDFRKKYSKQIEMLLARDLINQSFEGIQLTQKGREISNSIFIEFME
ncbi:MULTISPECIES: radical SAM family heme chaperone HemW [unclassified Clostridioides]|uniref:radical SAM family heme chaperone HemW n=1 Tax=unclassified Clostridioides TaxID=2635829 RepID=UPI001D0C5D71|nr:oxygen-independent coproporphyrinogen III oxidase [Clostridioides sp. ES-S-0001-02]MCC0639185.1 oxygen-independent coproporphyrinogen III oxidase [Clostridioides sp. ES-S-0049-03]MCC0675575.1 oxygen-independent coproporphyrinogen III oxidase [Clostridioides sp. ES-W-0018-02]MCC0707622.1 oxygen-independent coproporphyrinogen III oxidase [Clostridioides sp. ES-S-0190-01]MCC0709616.1 oxygen-independent coproporphyrinogen III oxidase [Clostridioides sp. ES-W-0017-02]MCC0761612.1 oxygen-independ